MAGSSGPRSRPQYEAGKYDAVVGRLREVADANPQYALLAYNLACLESLTGHPAEAVERLRRAIELSEQFRDYATTDTDLDAIRGEPEFQALVVGPTHPSTPSRRDLVVRSSRVGSPGVRSGFAPMPSRLRHASVRRREEV